MIVQLFSLRLICSYFSDSLPVLYLHLLFISFPFPPTVAIPLGFHFLRRAQNILPLASRHPSDLFSPFAVCARNAELKVGLKNKSRTGERKEGLGVRNFNGFLFKLDKLLSPSLPLSTFPITNKAKLA